jgi:hypothetical protein
LLELGKSFHSLHQRSYWDRIWTLQEVVSAKLAIVYCGHASLRYNNLVKGLIRLCELELNGPPLTMLQMVSRHVLSNAQSLNSLLIAKDNMVNLLIAQLKAASEPKDKIFAVRDFFSRSFGCVNVDYD